MQPLKEVSPLICNGSYGRAGERVATAYAATESGPGGIGADMAGGLKNY
jgi:hypothetical protein